jgi:hypothetical protein
VRRDVGGDGVRATPIEPLRSPYLRFESRRGKNSSNCRRPSSAPSSGDAANGRPLAPGRRSPNGRYVDSSSPAVSCSYSCRSGLRREIIPKAVGTTPALTRGGRWRSWWPPAPVMAAGARPWGPPTAPARGGQLAPALPCT